MCGTSYKAEQIERTAIRSTSYLHHKNEIDDNDGDHHHNHNHDSLESPAVTFMVPLNLHVISWRIDKVIAMDECQH